LPVRFDLKGLSAGQFCYGPQGLWYRFNPWVFAVDFPLHLRETVAHEVAHYVTYILHGRGGIKPHGPQWRGVMATLGFPRARARGDYSVAGVPRQRQSRYPYVCGCGPHLLTATRHRRAHEGSVYVCRRCNQPLQYSGE
jgi:SprT protein